MSESLDSFGQPGSTDSSLTFVNLHLLVRLSALSASVWHGSLQMKVLPFQYTFG